MQPQLSQQAEDRLDALLDALIDNPTSVLSSAPCNDSDDAFDPSDVSEANASEVPPSTAQQIALKAALEASLLATIED